MRPDEYVPRYYGSHDGRGMQVHTLAISEQDSLIAYLEDEIQPAIATSLAEIGPTAALVGVVADQTTIDAAVPGHEWDKAGKFLVTAIGDPTAIGPVYNALVAAMLTNPSGSIRTVFGLTARAPAA